MQSRRLTHTKQKVDRAEGWHTQGTRLTQSEQKVGTRRAEGWHSQSRRLAHAGQSVQAATKRTRSIDMAKHIYPSCFCTRLVDG